jgi:hypothetical protein
MTGCVAHDPPVIAFCNVSGDAHNVRQSIKRSSGLWSPEHRYDDGGERPICTEDRAPAVEICDVLCPVVSRILFVRRNHASSIPLVVPTTTAND